MVNPESRFRVIFDFREALEATVNAEMYARSCAHLRSDELAAMIPDNLVTLRGNERRDELLEHLRDLHAADWISRKMEKQNG